MLIINYYWVLCYDLCVLLVNLCLRHYLGKCYRVRKSLMKHQALAICYFCVTDWSCDWAEQPAGWVMEQQSVWSGINQGVIIYCRWQDPAGVRHSAQKTAVCHSPALHQEAQPAHGYLGFTWSEARLSLCNFMQTHICRALFWQQRSLTSLVMTYGNGGLLRPCESNYLKELA